jgi:hypothetical protein
MEERLSFESESCVEIDDPHASDGRENAGSHKIIEKFVCVKAGLTGGDLRGTLGR